jgi:hypothetical protein
MIACTAGSQMTGIGTSSILHVGTPEDGKLGDFLTVDACDVGHVVASIGIRAAGEHPVADEPMRQRWRRQHNLGCGRGRRLQELEVAGRHAAGAPQPRY